jgi:uncharacterized membrane protein
MDLYSILKLLHVIAALAWVGGGLTMLAQAIFAVRDKGEAETIRSIEAQGALAKRWFIPASLLTVIFGVALAFVGGLWDQLWIILGLIGFAATFITGIAVFEPTAKSMNVLMSEGREDEAVMLGRRMLRIAKFDYTVMMLVIADMVLKPTWTDYPLLAVMAAVLIAGAAIFLFGFGRRPQAQAA